ASAVLPLTSVATTFTVVVPTAKRLPEAGVLTTEASSQLSVAVGLKLTAAPHLPASAFTSIFERAAITGAWSSTTITVKLASAVLPWTSVATTFTVVVPTAKNVPEAGALTIDATSQLSVAVGE